MYFSQCWRTRHRIVFVEKFYDFAFQGQKAMSKVQTIVCCSKFYQNDFRDKAKAPRREALASYNSSTSMKYFKMFIICEICPADHLKVGEKGLQIKGSFLAICNFVLSFSISNLVL